MADIAARVSAGRLIPSRIGRLFGTVRGTPVATRHRVNLDAPQYPSPQNHTHLRIQTHPVDDTPRVDPSGIDAFGSELPEPAAAVGVAAEPSLAARPLLIPTPERPPHEPQ